MIPVPLSIERSISVEDLLERHPDANRILIHSGVPCLVCGEPFWGTLEEVIRGSGKTEDEIDAVISELRKELDRTAQ
jgi:hypothetical protein